MSTGVWPAGTSEMARRIRSRDWSSSPLGPIGDWPQGLKAAVDIMLSTRQPALLFWGEQCASLYNDAFAALAGPERHPAMLGAPAYEAWPDAWEFGREEIERVARTGEPTWHENRRIPIRRNRRLENAYWTYSFGPIPEKAAPNGVGGVLLLCTETSEAVLARLENESRYRALIEAMDEGFLLADMVFDEAGDAVDIEYIEANPAAIRMLGIDLRGRRMSEVPAEPGACGLDRWGRIACTGEGERLERRSGPGNRWFDIYVFRPERREVESRRVAAIFQDITERKNIEEQLRLGEAHFRLLADATPQMIWVTDADGRVEFLNRQWNEYTGMADQHRTADDVAATVIHPDDAATTMERFREAARRRAIFETEHRIRSAEGEYRWFYVRADPHFDPDSDELVRWYGIGMDIHDRKLAQQALADADRHKDEFLAMLAHELRNPLSAIRNTARVMREEVGTPVLRTRLGSIERQVQRLTGLVDDLLDVSRVTRGLITLRSERVDVAETVRHAIDSVHALIEAKRHDVTITIPHRRVTVIGDPVRLEQIAVNLVANAAKYTDPGGRIEVAISVRDDCAVLRVCDNGIGMSPELVERVFELFSQAERGLARSEGGLGIGLTIARQLVELHGGTIHAKSEGPGAGSEFVVELPLAPAERVAEAADAPPARTRHDGSKCILVVDDRVENAESLALLLGASGHRVGIAADGPTALHKADELRPDLVVLDIGLPGMDGYEVAQRLRRNPHTREAVLVALTGYSQPSDRRRALDVGFDGYFVKPVNLDELEAFVNETPKPGHRPSGDAAGSGHAVHDGA